MKNNCKTTLAWKGFHQEGKEKCQKAGKKVNFTTLIKVRSLYFLLGRANRRNNTRQAAAANCLPAPVGPSPLPCGICILTVFPFSTWANEFSEVKWLVQDLVELGLIPEPIHFLVQYHVSPAQYKIRCPQSTWAALLQSSCVRGLSSFPPPPFSSVW